MTGADRIVFTIGHSTHSIDTFIGLLQKHGVTALADVRSVPYSRFNRQFNKDVLADKLKAHGIRYDFLGHELGARSNDPSCYENGRVQYARLAQTALFRKGIEWVRNAANEYCIALMCAEKDPLECHRALLVARVLDEQGVPVTHILSDGSTESHDETMTRLLDLFGLREDLFRSRADLIAEALRRQEEKVAYVNERLAAQAEG
jgi:uncharacterized protein (DUF488 family)